MATNDYNLSHPASPDDVQGTGWHQADAGAGRHWGERRRRGAAIQQCPLPLPRVASPLAGLNDSQAFVDEWRRDNAPHQNVAARALAGGVLGLALVRAAQYRRGRR